MKFKLDENVPLGLKKVIEHSGYESCDVYVQKLNGKSDALVFARCVNEKYVLLTNDRDFENIYAYPPFTHPGIIVFKLKSQGIFAVTKAFQRLTTIVNLDKLSGCVLVVGPDFIKVRRAT